MSAEQLLAAAETAAEDAVARIVVAGHVDHGKSTLIGRMLYDLGALHQSKIDDVVASSARRGAAPEWSYVLDSLQEERDQAITIDTTRLWFSHAGRRYVIIDAPGHRQFLANMLSGASEADAAILVVDATRGIEDQTLRHAYLLRFLGVRHVVVALNKIDLLGADAAARVASLSDALAASIDLPLAAIVPVSAAHGDNIATRSAATPWYGGATIAESLALVRRATAPVDRALRLPVRDVYRRDGVRVLAGTLASGRIVPGASLRLLPSHETVRVARLLRWPDGEVPEARAGETIALVLEGDRFVQRGDVLADAAAPPAVAREVEVELFWLDPVPPARGDLVRIKRATQQTSAVVEDAPRIYDVERARDDDDAPAQHNVVRLTLHAAAPLVFDPRGDDLAGSRTVVLRGDRVAGIGFLVGAPRGVGETGVVTPAERERRAGHAAGIVWLTGLSGAGKSTLARAAERRLFDRGAAVTVIDGDALRSTVNADLGFSDADRAESVRRAGAVAQLLAAAGQIVIVALISPFARDRDALRAAASQPFYEIFVDASLATCEARDPKGLYRRARSGALSGFTGIDSPYETPAAPDLVLRTGDEPVEASVARLVDFVETRFFGGR